MRMATGECSHAIRECAKPVVAAINGAVGGSGLAMLASVDIRSRGGHRRAAQRSKT